MRAVEKALLPRQLSFKSTAAHVAAYGGSGTAPEPQAGIMGAHTSGAPLHVPATPQVLLGVPYTGA